MLALAESKEEVLEALKKDIYSKSGVWDWNKVQIHPVCTAISISPHISDWRSSNLHSGWHCDALIATADRDSYV